MLGGGQSNNLQRFVAFWGFHGSVRLQRGNSKGLYKESVDVDVRTLLLTCAYSHSSKARVFARTR